MVRAVDIRTSPIPLLVAHDDDPSGPRLRISDSLVRVRFQVYAPAKAWRELAPWDRYLARVHAYALISPGAIFSHESAAALRGLPVFKEPRDVHVYDPDRSRSTRYGDVVVHTSMDARLVVEGGGLLMTSPLDTALDLGRVLPPALGLAVCDAFARLDASTGMGAFGAAVEAQVNPRGRSRLRWLFERADPRSESAGESVSRAVIDWLGFDGPNLQHEFRYENHRDRSDFYWPRARVIGESDGYGKYDATSASEMRRHFVEEKRREDRLRRHERGLARWDWFDSMRGYPVGDKLRAAGLRPIRPLNAAALATLGRNRRSP